MTHSSLFRITFAVALLLCATPVFADVVYWDTNGSTAGFGTASGTWAAPTPGGTTGWSLDSTGASAIGSVTTTTADTVNFGTDTDGLGAGTINISGTVEAAILRFGKASGPIVVSGGTIDMSVPGTAQIQAFTSGGSTSSTHTINSNITKSGGTIRVGRQNTSGENYIFNGVLSGAFSFDSRAQNNTSAITLNGLNTFTGNMSIVTGQINANTIANKNVASSLGAGTTISMAGGGGQNPTLWYTGTTAASTDRDVNLNGGSNRIVSQDAELTLAGNVTGVSGGFQSSIILSGDAGGGGNFNEISGVIGGNARVSVQSYAPQGGSAENGFWKLSGVNTYTGSTTVSNGSYLMIDGAGQLGSGTHAGNIFINNSATFEYSSTADQIITGTISGTGTGGLVKSENSTLDILMKSGTYSGPTTINGGTLRFTNEADLRGIGGAAIAINNGSTLEFQSSVGGANRTVLNNKTFTFGSTGGGTINFNGGNHLFQGGGSTHNIVTTGGSTNTVSSTSGGFMNMQGAGNVIFNVADGSDGVDLDLSAFWNNGLITKNGAGTMAITGTHVGSYAIAINEGTLEVGASSQLAGGTFTAGMSNDGTFRYNSSQAQTMSGAISGTGAIIKDNAASTLTLAGTNSYDGTTTVNAGTLVINGDNSAATGDVSIAGGATLGGSGTVGGATTISGMHAPGESVGLQTFTNGLTYNAGSTIEWELTANVDDSNGIRGFDFDGIDLTTLGDLTFNANTTLDLRFDSAGSSVDFGAVFWSQDREWTIFNTTGGAINGFVGNFGADGMSNLNINTGSGANGTFSLTSDANNVYLKFTAVPEPGTLAMFGIGIGILSARRRRQSSL